MLPICSSLKSAWRAVRPILATVGLLCIAACGGSSASSGGGTTPPLPQDFSLSVTPTTLTAYPGTTATVTIYEQGINGFTGSIATAITGLPAGVTASPVTLQGLSSQSATVTLTIAANAVPVSNVAVTFTGTSGTLTHTATFTLTVSGPQGISLTVQPTLSVIRGTTQTILITANAINGFSGIVGINVTGLPTGVTANTPLYLYAGSGGSITFSASASASGSSTITFTGTNSTGTLSTQSQSTVTVITTPDFTLGTGAGTGLGINAGASGNVPVYMTAYNGFSGSVNVTLTNLPPGVTVSPSSFTLAPGVGQTITVSAALSTAPSSTVVTLQGTSGAISNTGSFNLFTLAPTLVESLQPTSVTVPAGGTSAFAVNILADGYTNSPTGAASVAITGVPTGVAVSQTIYSIAAPGGSTQIYLTAAANGAQAGTLTVTATYGSQTQAVKLPIVIGPPTINTAVPLKSRTRYIRSDSTMEYSGYPPPNWTVYDPPTARFFASDPSTNHVNVFDSVSEKQIGRIVIPGAFGMDESPDHTVLYVGTYSGDLYTVDPVAMTITRRYPSDTISPYGFPANAVFALANGKLLLMRYFLVPGYSEVDGNGPIALWNPADNSIVEFTGSASLGTPVQNSCFQGFEFGILTNNRTRFLITPTITAEGSSILCSFDPNAGTWVYSPVITDGDGDQLSWMAVTPDGNTVAVFDGVKIYILDAATLAIERSFAVSSPQTIGTPSLWFGSDNQTLYMSGFAENAFLYAYNSATGTQIGWLPMVQSNGVYGNTIPYLQGLSANGLLGGVTEQGFGFVDTNALNPLPLGTPFGPSSLIAAPYGPLSGGTLTSWLQDSNLTLPPLGSVYFGTTAATGVSGSILQQQPTIFATSPASVAGAVDVITLSTDGGEQIIPEGFSYGPVILEAPTSYATAEGGGPAEVYGYGFGPSYLSNAVIAPPSGLQVLAGGTANTITGYLPGPFGIYGFSVPPSPLTGAEFGVPPGIDGSSINLTVTNATGSSTAARAITYLPAIQTFPLQSSQLLDGVYDAKRDLYYFTDVNQVQVFSRTQGKFLSPFPIAGSSRLFGIALSPDQSKLVISDSGNYSLYVLDPDSPATIAHYSLNNKVFGGANTEVPSGVAITNSGQIYFAAFDTVGDGASALLHFNPTSGTLTALSLGQTPISSSEADDTYGRLPMSSDGTRIYINNGGTVGYVDTATDVGIASSQTGDLGQDGFEVVLSANQSTVFADGFMMDSQTDVTGFQALNYRESFDADYVYGATLSPDGSLFFQPGYRAIDVFDGRTGAFRARVSLSVTLTPNYRALIGDNKDNVQVAITGDTGNGIAVIDLGAIPEPNPLTYPQQTSTIHANLQPLAAARRSPRSVSTGPRLAPHGIRINRRTMKFPLAR